MDKTNNAILGYLAGAMAGVLAGCITGWTVILAEQSAIYNIKEQSNWFSFSYFVWFVGLLGGWFLSALPDARLRIIGAGWLTAWIFSTAVNVLFLLVFEKMFLSYPQWASGWFIGCIVGAICGWYSGIIAEVDSNA